MCLRYVCPVLFEEDPEPAAAAWFAPSVGPVPGRSGPHPDGLPPTSALLVLSNKSVLRLYDTKDE